MTAREYKMDLAVDLAKMGLLTGGMQIPCVVDTMEGDAEEAFDLIPCKYIIIEDGESKYQGDHGPDGYFTKKVEDWLRNRFD